MSGPPPGDLELQAPDAEVAIPQPDRQYAMLIHLSGFLSYLLGPLAIVVTLALWLARKDESPFINDHGREAMNYSISIWLYAAMATMLTLILIGCFILPALVVFDIIVVIMAAVAASGGRYYRYPITIRFITG
jgi:uncharacterized Tic20 family protein